MTAAILAGMVIDGTDVPALDAYELSFWIVGAGAMLAAAVALGNALRYPRDDAGL